MTVLTADGCIEDSAVQAFADTGCCPPAPCNISLCALFCTFAQLLPNGPMWDRYKADAMRRFSTSDRCDGATGGQIACGACNEDDVCITLVDYAVYTAHVLHDLIRGALIPSLNEQSAQTARQTQIEWLNRLGWVNCFQSCRDPILGALTPLEYETDCGPGYVANEPVPEELTLAVNRGIILALKRLKMSPINNLCGINWVLEPLGAELTPMNSGTFVNEFGQTCASGCDAADQSCCPTRRFNLGFRKDAAGNEIRTLPRVHAYCADTEEEGLPDTIDAGYASTNPLLCDGDGRETCNIPDDQNFRLVYPALLAAHCIAQSMLTPDPGTNVPPIVRTAC